MSILQKDDIRDGLARLPYQGRDRAWTRTKGWKDVQLVNEVTEGVVTIEDVEDEYDVAGASESERHVDEPTGVEMRERHEDKPNGDKLFETTVPQDMDGENSEQKIAK